MLDEGTNEKVGTGTPTPQALSSEKHASKDTEHRTGSQFLLWILLSLSFSLQLWRVKGPIPKVPSHKDDHCEELITQWQSKMSHNNMNKL